MDVQYFVVEFMIFCVIAQWPLGLKLKEISFQVDIFYSKESFDLWTNIICMYYLFCWKLSFSFAGLIDKPLTFRKYDYSEYYPELLQAKASWNDISD